MNNGKIVIGTAQFGMDYGISNKTGKVDLKNVEQILNYSYNKGIKTLDTASAYGTSEEVLGIVGVKNFNVVSKFVAENEDELNITLDNSLNKLKVNQLYGYLAHRPQTIFQNPNLWEELLKLKSENKILNIGFSVNEISEFEKINKLKFKPDIIQLPFNLLDNRFKKVIESSNQNGTTVYSRSTFLQGVFFLDPDKLEGKFREFDSSLRDLKSICLAEGLDIADLALSYALKQTGIHKVLIGIQNFDQFKNNVDSISRDISQKTFDTIRRITINNKELLNPSNW